MKLKGNTEISFGEKIHMFSIDMARELIRIGGVLIKLGHEQMEVRSLVNNIVPLSIINLNDKGKNERFFVQGNLCFAKTV